MATKGKKILKQIEAQEVIDLLNKAYADEWLAYYQYFIEAKIIKGIMKSSIITELEEHAADELRHATMLANRIAQLGGEPILNPKDWFKYANCAYEEPTNPDVLNILKQAIKGEQCAIEVYNNIIETTKNKDIITYNIASQILADEVEHEEDLQALYEDINEFIEQFK
jgi:bacterioferritin